MILTTAEPFIAGVQVGEVSVQCLKEPLLMSAKYALISARDLRDGRVLKQWPLPQGTLVDVSTHGACSAYPNNWSPETMKKLGELIESMEKDLIQMHFKEGRHVVQSDAGLGAGEGEEAPQV